MTYVFLKITIICKENKTKQKNKQPPPPNRTYGDNRVRGTTLKNFVTNTLKNKNKRPDPDKNSGTVFYLVTVKECINATINIALCLRKGLRLTCGSGCQQKDLQLVSYCEVVEGGVSEI